MSTTINLNTNTNKGGTVMETTVRNLCNSYANDIIRSFEAHYPMWEHHKIYKTSIDAYVIILFFTDRHIEYSMSVKEAADLAGVSAGKAIQIADRLRKAIIPASVSRNIYKACDELGINIDTYTVVNTCMDILYDNYKSIIEDVMAVM